MKKYLLIIFIFLLLLSSACKLPIPSINYRQQMREFVQNLSIYAKSINPNFIIIPQNGQELLTDDGESDGNPVIEYIDAIDGVGREDLYFGYYEDNEATPIEDLNYMLGFLILAKNFNKKVLVIDYCWTISNVDNSYTENNNNGFISFAADRRELDNIPSYPSSPYNENADNINSLLEAKNFLYLINPQNYSSKNDFINALIATNFDIILIDLFFFDQQLSPSDIDSLKTKANGGKRLVICYMSIGEAEDYRYYWQSSWYTDPPSWLLRENPNWPGNYVVKYWYKEWQDIIFGNDDSYLKKILDAGFDGVYLDIIDAFENFE